MSRTYKRTNQGNKKCWLPDWRFTDEYFIGWCTDYSKSPSWYTREFETVPKRRKDRDDLIKIRKEEIDPDDHIWTLSNRPRNYYW